MIVDHHVPDPHPTDFPPILAILCAVARAVCAPRALSGQMFPRRNGIGDCGKRGREIRRYRPDETLEHVVSPPVRLGVVPRAAVGLDARVRTDNGGKRLACAGLGPVDGRRDEHRHSAAGCRHHARTVRDSGILVRIIRNRHEFGILVGLDPAKAHLLDLSAGNRYVGDHRISDAPEYRLGPCSLGSGPNAAAFGKRYPRTLTKAEREIVP